MTDRRLLVHGIFLLLLPVVVAIFDWSVLTAVIFVLLMLLWRWLIVLSGFVAPEKSPHLVLESISASHFVEKVRWNMDVAGIDYVEQASGGTLGAYFTGRTVPLLKVHTGAVRSRIGNSAEILRFLWGAYVADPGFRTAHLEPTLDRLELEQRFDRYGVNLQVWIYHHLLDDRDLTLHAWGADSPTVPAWQRWILKPLFPLLAWLIRRSFRITPERFEKARDHIEELLMDVEGALADGRTAIIEGDERNYTDYQFAAMTGLWLQPEDYGGGRADYVRIDAERAPPAMRRDVERWIENYPRVTNWVRRLYAEER